MSIQILKGKLPAYASKLADDLNVIINPKHISLIQALGCAISAAIACKSQTVLAEVMDEASHHITEQDLNLARQSAAYMGLTNVYYSFGLLAEDKDFVKIDPQFNMKVESQSNEADAEFYQVAAAAIGQCEGCIKVHNRALLKMGFSKEHIMEAVKIAGIVNSAARILHSIGDICDEKLPKVEKTIKNSVVTENQTDG